MQTTETIQIQSLPSFTVCRVLVVSKPEANSSETYSSTTLQPSALLWAIRINFWRIRINSLPSTIKLVRFLFSGTFAEVNLLKNWIDPGIIFKLLLVTFEFHESNLLVRPRFRLDLFTLLIQFNFKIAFEHREDTVTNDRRISGIRSTSNTSFRVTLGSVPSPGVDILDRSTRYTCVKYRTWRARRIIRVGLQAREIERKWRKVYRSTQQPNPFKDSRSV